MRLFEGLITAIPCFTLAATLLLTWIEPMSIDDGHWVRFGVGIMVLEFVLVHSGAFVANMGVDKETSTLNKLKVFTELYIAWQGQFKQRADSSPA